MWRLKNILLNNQWLKKKSKEKNTEAKENGNATNQNLQDAAKVVLRGTVQ